MGAVHLREGPPGQVRLGFRLSTRTGADVAATLRGCTPLGPPRATPAGALVASESDWQCPTGLRDVTLRLGGLTGTPIQVAAYAALADGGTARAVLDAGHPEWTPATAPPGVPAYLRLGVVHILGGADHLAFLLGLLLLVRSRRSLVATVTAFTLGHSVTLALAALGHIAVRPAPVEAGVALSVLLVALEATRPPRDLAHRAPWLVASGFGLLHGLGFAGALAAVGLPPGGVAGALFGFNLGVEAGQLGVVLVALALVRGVPATLRPAGRHAVATLIGGVAVWWTLDRAAAIIG